MCIRDSSRAAGGRDGLSVEGLCCRYKREPPIFQNLSFSARPGEVMAVTGDTGVGKRTLSRCLCGLMRESAGTIRLNGRILGPKQRQRIAYCVMQDAVSYTHLDVYKRQLQNPLARACNTGEITTRFPTSASRSGRTRRKMIASLYLR